MTSTQIRPPSNDLVSGRPLVGIVGLGRFGGFLARHLLRYTPVLGFDVRTEIQVPDGITLVSLDEVCRARILILAVPIRKLRETARACAPLVRPRTLVMDVASVKTWPTRWLTESFSDEIELAGTHPMFGPDSAVEGLRGQSIVFVPIRLRAPRWIGRLLERQLELRVITTTAEQHDRETARSLALVHLTGRVWSPFTVTDPSFELRGYRLLREVTRLAGRDTDHLFEDMHRWNPFAAEARSEFLQRLQSEEERLHPPESTKP